MFNFSPAILIPGILFSIIGWVAFRYGRSLQLWKPISLGLALMISPLFIGNVWLLWGVGAALLATLWFHHDE